MTRKGLCGWRTVAKLPAGTGAEVWRQVRPRAWGRGELQAREVRVSGPRVDVLLVGSASVFAWASGAARCGWCGASVVPDARGSWIDASGGDGCGEGVHAAESSAGLDR